MKDVFEVAAMGLMVAGIMAGAVALAVGNTPVRAPVASAAVIH